MKKEEFEIYNKMTHEKYKYYKVWKWLAIIFIAISVGLCVLLIANGCMFNEVHTVNNNDVEIINEGSNNDNAVTINN